MPVYKIDKYKMINGKKVLKSKEQWNKETCGGKKIWFFKCQYTNLLGEIKQKRSKQYATKDEASTEEAKFKLDTNNNNNSNVTIYDIYNAYFFLDDNILNRDSSIYTKESRSRLYILPFFKDKKTQKYDDISKINVEKLKKWKIWLNNVDAEIRKYDENGEKIKIKLSLQTKQSIFNTFSSLMTYATEKYNLEYNPLKLIENFKEKNDKVIDEEQIRYITNEEYKLFINEIDDYEYKVIFHLLYEIGCRKGEMASLKWKNVNFKNGKIKFNTTFSRTRKGGLDIKNTKNNKIKYIDISNNLKEELKQLYNTVKEADDFNNEWFVFGGIRPISYSTLKRKKEDAFKRLQAKKINIPEITIHEFRHSSASYMISNNIPIEVIAYRLGDSPETIRKVYAHLFPDTQKSAKNLFENL